MRLAAAALLFLSACTSGGTGGGVVDASQVGAPFSWVGGGFSAGEPQIMPGGMSTSEEMLFLFENVSGRPQTIETFSLRQLNESSAPLRIDATSRRIGRMFEPGEELEVKLFVNVTPQSVPRGAQLGPRGVALDVVLRHADGTSYRYPIHIPIRTSVGTRP